MGPVELLLFALAVRYITTILRFDLKTEGFFVSSTDKAYIRVARVDVVEKYPVNLFNRIQRLFGAFSVAKNGEGIAVWRIEPNRMAVWICPVCLSFWVGAVLALLCLGIYLYNPVYLIPTLLVPAAAGFASYDKS